MLSIVTIDQAAAVFMASYLVMGSLIGLSIMTSASHVRRANAWFIAAVAIPLLLTGMLFSVKLYRAASLVEGIVLEAKVDVRSGPGEENTTLFTVHEGLKVRVRNERGSWRLISLENGLNGWLPGNALGII